VAVLDAERADDQVYYFSNCDPNGPQAPEIFGGADGQMLIE
jgi:hypothetical protein